MESIQSMVNSLFEDVTESAIIKNFDKSTPGPGPGKEWMKTNQEATTGFDEIFENPLFFCSLFQRAG
jgi:hypothetical protein